MSKTSERKLSSVPSTGQDYDPTLPTMTRKQRLVSGTVAPFILAVAFAGKPAEQAAVGAFDGIKAFLGSSGNQGDGPSMNQLREWPHQVTITPATQAAALEGPGAMGELVDPQVYQGPQSSTTETKRLDDVITTGPEQVGASYKVPVLDPKAFAARQAQHPNSDFVIGPVKNN